MQPATIQLPPFTIVVDEVPVLIIEVRKFELFGGDVIYSASVQILYKGIRSKVFPVDAKDYNGLINKLKAEIDKVKFIEYAYGLDEVRRLIS